MERDCYNCPHSEISYFEHDTGYEERVCTLINTRSKCPLEYKKIGGKETMKLNIELGNLAEEVKMVLEEASKDLIREEIIEVIKGNLEENLKEEIKDQVDNNIKDYINNYIKTYKIVIGNSLLDEDVKEYTIEQYTKKQLKEILEKESITVIEKGKYGYESKKKITFEEYITKQIPINLEIKRELDNQVEDIRDNINKKIKEIFDTSTKEVLSSTLMNALSANETYQKINNSILRIASKEGNE